MIPTIVDTHQRRTGIGFPHGDFLRHESPDYADIHILVLMRDDVTYPLDGSDWHGEVLSVELRILGSDAVQTLRYLVDLRVAGV